jgi:leucyl aminopeptidase
MPFHKDYVNKLESKLADYVNCDISRAGGANTAAEFIKLFSGNANFIHADIAGSNERKTTFVPVLVRTLFYLAQK